MQLVGGLEKHLVQVLWPGLQHGLGNACMQRFALAHGRELISRFHHPVVGKAQAFLARQQEACANKGLQRFARRLCKDSAEQAFIASVACCADDAQYIALGRGQAHQPVDHQVSDIVGIAVPGHGLQAPRPAHGLGIEGEQLVLDHRPEDLVDEKRVAGGLVVQDALRRLALPWPIVFMTGFGTIPMTVQAMRAGAVEFLTKPFDEDQLLTLLQAVRHKAVADGRKWRHARQVEEKYQRLTPREREVFSLVVDGLSHKQIARQIGTSEVTTKVHKKNIMNKMQSRSLVELVAMHTVIGARPEGLGGA